MKRRNLFLFGLLLMCSFGFSQEPVQDSIYIGTEVVPEYPDGGINGFRQFVARNFMPPDVETDLKGLVVVSFIIEIDGSISEVQVKRDLGFGTGEEAVRVVSKSKKWKPGIQEGRPVRVRYSLPIRLHIEGNGIPQEEADEE